MDLLIFDLDGTLVDSKLDLAESVNAVRAGFGLEPLDLETVGQYVGNGAPVLLRRALGPEASEEQIRAGVEQFLAYYREHLLDHTRPYPGIPEALAELASAGVRMAVLSNKPVRPSTQIVEGLGLAPYFARVYGGNSFGERKKPDPVGVETLLGELGVARERAMIVGDSAVDVRTARNAGIRSCGVRYGFQPESFESDPPDMMVDRPAELVQAVIAERNHRGALPS